MNRADPQEPIRRMTAVAVELAAAAPNQTEAVTRVLLHLNQLAAILGGSPGAGEPRRVLSSLYSHLVGLTGESEEAAQKVQTLVEMLNELAAEGRLYASADTPTSRLPRARHDASRPRYLVHHGSRGPRLVETREGSEKSFYVTREDYDAVVAALAQCAQPQVRFEPLHKAFVRAGGSPTKSAYPLRVVLRFLRQLDPPLLAGQQGSYRLTSSPERFRKQAARAWNALEER